MVDWARGSGWFRLKVLLLIICIGFALIAVYFRTRPPQPARLAPGFTPEFGRSAARYADPQEDTRSGQIDSIPQDRP